MHMKRKTAKVARWLHVYLSMASFALVLFFAVTGLTLNHQDWFEHSAKTKLIRGTVPATLLSKPGDPQVAAYLREHEHLKGAPSDPQSDDDQITLSFRGPGYSADCTITRANGRYQIVETRNGLWSVLNDLHKGRDSGQAWKGFIDVSAVLLTVVSLSGLMLIFFLYRKRTAGLLLACTGLVMILLLYRIFVP
jgi:uncharacterized protein